MANQRTSADLSLGVVDEAIYAIRPDETPDILNYFYGRTFNSVYTDNSLTYYFNGEAGTRRMRLAALRSPSLPGFKPERLVRPKIRKAFPDTFLLGSRHLSRPCRACRRDRCLTRSRRRHATVRGVTPDARFGGAVLKTIVPRI